MENNNKENNNFHNLVKELSESERVLLLNKLKKYTDNNEDVKKEIPVYSKNTISENKELKKFLKNTFEHYNFFVKIFLYIVCFFKGSDLQEEVLFREINLIKDKLIRNFPKYFDTEENKLKCNILEKFIPLIKEIKRLNNLTQDFFKDDVYIFDFIMYYIEENDDSLNKYLADLNPDSLEKNVELLERINYNNEKEKRLKALFSNIKETNFIKSNIYFNKLSIFLKLLNYDYEYILNLFQIKNLEQPLNDLTGVFVNDDIIYFFESFHKYIISIDYELISTDFFKKNFFEYLKKYSNIIDNDEKAIAIGNSITNIFNIIDDIKNSFPFEDIIRFFTNNILYVTVPYKNNLNILEIYKTYKRNIIDKLWENKYKEIKERNIVILVNELFPNYNFDSLPHLNINLIQKIEKYSNLKVRNYYCLTLLHKFLSTTYLDSISSVINKIIIEGNFIKDLVKSNFHSAYYALKSTLDNINIYDMQFKEDNVYYKKIFNLIYKIGSDPNFKTILINLIADMNEEINKIVFDGIEAIKTINTVFKSLINSEQNPQKILSNYNEIKVPHYQNLNVASEKISQIIDKFLVVYRLVEESY